MLATLIAASAIADLTVSDFFPLTPGGRRTYEEKLDRTTVNIDVIGTPAKIKGVTATPIMTMEGGKEISTTYYRIDNDAVWIVATDPEHPLPKPIPIIQSRGDQTKWSYEGPTDDGKQAELVTMTGESRILPDRVVLGKKVPILEVKLTTEVGAGLAKERIEQVALYGKGVGLVQLTSKTTVGKRRATNELRLVKVEEAKSDG